MTFWIVSSVVGLVPYVFSYGWDWFHPRVTLWSEMTQWVFAGIALGFGFMIGVALFGLLVKESERRRRQELGLPSYTRVTKPGFMSGDPGASGLGAQPPSAPTGPQAPPLHAMQEHPAGWTIPASRDRANGSWA